MLTQFEQKVISETDQNELQQILTQLKPPPDISEFKTAIDQLATLLAEIAAIDEELKKKVELGEVESIRLLKRQAEEKFDQASLLTITITKIQEELHKNFSAVRASFKKGHQKLKKLIKSYGVEHCQSVFDELERKAKEFNLQRKQKIELQEKYRTCLDQYQSRLSNKPNYRHLIARAKAIKAELDFAKIVQQIDGLLTDVARKAEEIKPVFDSLRDLPLRWTQTLAGLREKAGLGLSMDPAFENARLAVKQFANEESAKQDTIEKFREKMLGAIHEANGLCNGLQQKYDTIAKRTELLAISSKIQQAWEIRSSVPVPSVTSNPLRIAGSLETQIDDQHKIARRNKKINERRQQKKDRLYDRFLRLIQNINFWKNKLTRKFISRRYAVAVGGTRPEGQNVYVSHSVAALYKILQKPQGTDDCLAELKKTAEERKQLPTRNYYYRIKYYFFARDAAVTQLLDALSTMNLQEPNCEAVENLLPQVPEEQRDGGRPGPGVQ